MSKSLKFMTLRKEIEDKTNNCKDILCSWIRKINIAKCLLSKQATDPM